MPSSSAHDIFRRYGQGIPVDVETIARDMGFKVIADPDLSCCGQASIENGIPVIRYRESDSLVRRRFTISHEIGHFVLGHTDTGTKLRDVTVDPSLDPNEIDANTFAAELLVPRVVLDLIMSRGAGDSIKHLADTFGVSGAVMEYRLKSLGYIPQNI